MQEPDAAGKTARHPWRMLRAPLVALVIALIGSVGCLVWFEDQLIFFPSRYPEGRWDPSRLSSPGHPDPISIENVWLTAEDGISLNGWYATHAGVADGAAGPPPVILWFHGNAGNLTDRYEMLVGMVKLPAEVLILDYRGYGRSEGRPSEEGLYRDARAAWKYLTSERKIPPGRIVVFGKSLGGGPAVELAHEVKPAGLIVQSSFTSIPDMAARILPIVPRFLVRTKMDSVRKIRDILVPKLIIHSPDDEVVPYDLGKKLYEAAAEPKTFYEVPHARHNDTFIAGGSAYWQVLRDFLGLLRKERVHL